MGDGSGGRKAMRRTVSFKTSQLAREWARGAVGSASDWQSEGQGFESPRVHQFLTLRSTAKHLVSISPFPGLPFGAGFAQCCPISVVTTDRVSIRNGCCPFLDAMNAADPGL